MCSWIPGALSQSPRSPWNGICSALTHKIQHSSCVQMLGLVGSVHRWVVTGSGAWYSSSTAVISVRTGPCPGHAAGPKPLHVPGLSPALEQRWPATSVLGGCNPRGIVGLGTVARKYKLKEKKHGFVRINLCKSTKNIASYRFLYIFWYLNNKDSWTGCSPAIFREFKPIF